MGERAPDWVISDDLPVNYRVGTCVKWPGKGRDPLVIRERSVWPDSYFGCRKRQNDYSSLTDDSFMFDNK